MVRRFLSLLLLFPLLLPQGVCVCHFASPTCAAAGTEDDEADSQAFAHNSCRDHEHSLDEQSHSAAERAGHRHGPTPAEQPDQHTPGCPALKPAFVQRQAVDTATPLGASVCVLVCRLPDADAAGRHTPAAIWPDFGSPNRPLYLTLLTLRI